MITKFADLWVAAKSKIIEAWTLGLHMVQSMKLINSYDK